MSPFDFSGKSDTTLWTLRSRDGRWVSCVLRFVSNGATETGVEVELAWDGSPLISHVFTTGDEAVEWANSARTTFDQAIITPATIKPIDTPPHPGPRSDRQSKMNS